MNVTTNFGKNYSGWWFGVWQDGRLVAFGAGYRDKRRCFKHERKSVKMALAGEMPEVRCMNAAILPRGY